MPDLAEYDPAVIRNCVAKLEALNPIADKLEAFNANLAAATAQLKTVKDDLAALVAERDRVRGEYAAARSELVTIQGALTAAFKRYEELQRQIQKMERSV